MSAESAPAPGRYVALPPCDSCGELDSGAYGFAPPTWPSVQHFCLDCTPSRTGALGLTAARPGVARDGAQVDLFGRSI